MKGVYIFGLIIGMVFIFSSNSWAFRCGVELISKGDNKIKTSLTCGEPTSKEQRCLAWHRETGICVNHGEAWYYNCGDQDFIYVLVFSEGGELMHEETSGRGMGFSQCRGKLAR